MDQVPRIVDREAYRHARRRARPDDDLLARFAGDLVDRLDFVNRTFDRAVDIGARSDHLARALVDGGKARHVVRLDDLPDTRPDIVASPEWLPLAGQALDLAVSLFALQHCDDLPGTLAQIRAALRPDGLFIGAIAAGDTLHELRDAITTAESEITGGAAPHVMPFVRLPEAGALMQRTGWALPVVDRDAITVRYPTLRDLVRDLRRSGATNVLADRTRRPLARAVWRRCEAIYAERYTDSDGRLRATLDVVWLSGWAPDASQQQPLRPGAASVRLADALGTTERAAGEKAGPGNPS